MTKVLPRVAGDASKFNKEQQDDGILQLLSAVLATYLKDIWQDNRAMLAEGELPKSRPDLLRTDIATQQPCQVACRSQFKLDWMQAKLDANGFTTFWP